MTAPITSNGPITTRLHHYAGRYLGERRWSGVPLLFSTQITMQIAKCLAFHNHRSRTR